MNRDEFLLQHKKLCDEAHNILQEKVQNYSGGGNVFTNFSRVESLGICSTPTGILARISDKFGRLITHTNTKGGLVVSMTVLLILLTISYFYIAALILGG